MHTVQETLAVGWDKRMSEKMDVRRFILAVGLSDYFAFRLLDPFYLQFLTTSRGLNLGAVAFGLFVGVSGAARLLFDYVTGVFADRLGRRTAWAIAAFLYALALWILAAATGLTTALIAAFVQGLSYAFQSGARQAWLYDRAGESGMRRAFSRVYSLSIPLGAAGIGLALLLAGRVDIRVPIVLTACVMAGVGLYVLRFPRDEAVRTGRSVADTFREGIDQIRSSRVLQLAAIQAVLWTLPVWVTSAWWFTYLVDRFGQSQFAATALFGVATLGTGFAGIALSRIRAGLAPLLLWPSVGAMLFFFAMSAAPSPLVLVAAVVGATACQQLLQAGSSLLRNAAIHILARDGPVIARDDRRSSMGSWTALVGRPH